MIKFKDTIIEGYKICPITGKIFNEVTGQIEKNLYSQSEESVGKELVYIVS